jgi:hypothetical protein
MTVIEDFSQSQHDRRARSTNKSPLAMNHKHFVLDRS